MCLQVRAAACSVQGLKCTDSPRSLELAPSQAPRCHHLTRTPTLVDISSRNCSSCFWPITRVLPNQRRSGWMRVLGSSLDCRSCVVVAIMAAWHWRVEEDQG